MTTPAASPALDALRARERAGALREAAAEIEAKRGEHWQQHLRDHPYADATSCPGDYGKHDAYADAARIVRDRADQQDQIRLSFGGRS
jgi:hypothetical protein